MALGFQKHVWAMVATMTQKAIRSLNQKKFSVFQLLLAYDMAQERN